MIFSQGRDSLKFSDGNPEKNKEIEEQHRQNQRKVYRVKENKNITGSYVFGGFLGFPGSDLDENWRKSS